MIDIKSYCAPELEGWQIMRKIEGDYYNASPNADPRVLQYMEEHQDFFQWYVFNWIDESEFIEYCEKRYCKLTFNQYALSGEKVPQLLKIGIYVCSSAVTASERKNELKYIAGIHRHV